MKSAASKIPVVNLARIDRWLWAVRMCKTRATAVAACRGGRVRVDGVVAKPARELKGAEIITVRDGPDTRTLKVLDFPAARVGAKLVPDYYEDLTLPKPKPEERQAAGAVGWSRERGAGRPTKRDRRRWETLLKES